MNYIEINFANVNGHSKLSDAAKNTFERIYKVHNSCHSNDYKKDWIPTGVQEYRDHIKVYFKNGEWLHYYPNGTWG